MKSRWLIGMAAWWAWLPGMAYAQEPDTTPPKFVLPPITVSATRSTLPLSKTPHAVQLVDKAQISGAKPTWRLDEALAAALAAVAVRCGQRFARACAMGQSTARLRAGTGTGFVNVARLGHEGERDRRGADLPNLTAGFQIPVRGWTLSPLAAVGAGPR